MDSLERNSLNTQKIILSLASTLLIPSEVWTNPVVLTSSLVISGIYNMHRWSSGSFEDHVVILRNVMKIPGANLAMITLHGGFRHVGQFVHRRVASMKWGI